MKHPADAVAENLKSIREQRGLSLDQLAASTGVSKSMLRQIETGQSSPTIATMWKIANGLHISFTALLHRQEVKAEVESFTAKPPLTASQEHYRVYPLVPFDPYQSFETYYLEIDPGTSFDGEPHQGNIQEYIFVTNGTLEVAIGEKILIIHSNEYGRFVANQPHAYKSVGTTGVTAIMQLTYAP